jgi:hypothetical protein
MNFQDIEKHIKSLKENGFSEEMIEDFLKYMEVTSKAPILLNPESTLTSQQQWAIACGADVAFANGHYLNELSTGFQKNEWLELLYNFWEVGSKSKALETINWMFEEGHRLQFDFFWQAMNIVSIKETKEFLWEHIVKDENEEAIAFHRLRNLRHGLDVFKQFNLFDTDTIPNMLIWDFARIINLSRGCYDAGYFSREEALELIMNTVGPIRKTYKSWRQLSISYQFARYFWRGIDERIFKELLAGMHLLLTHRNSPWVTLKWEDSE